MDQIRDLEAARRKIENTCQVHPDIGNHARAPTGKEYVIIVSGGLKHGERLPAYFPTPETAVAAWYEAATKYVAQGGTLYWRRLPSVECQHYLPVAENGEFGFADADLKKIMLITLYMVYSRMLVSSKPIIQPATIDREPAEVC